MGWISSHVIERVKFLSSVRLTCVGQQICLVHTHVPVLPNATGNECVHYFDHVQRRKVLSYLYNPFIVSWATTFCREHRLGDHMGVIAP